MLNSSYFCDSLTDSTSFRTICLELWLLFKKLRIVKLYHCNSRIWSELVFVLVDEGKI